MLTNRIEHIMVETKQFIHFRENELGDNRVDMRMDE